MTCANVHLMGKSSQRSAISLQPEGKCTLPLCAGRATLPRSRSRPGGPLVHVSSAGASPSRRILSRSDARARNAQVADFGDALPCGASCFSHVRPRRGRAKSGTNAIKRWDPYVARKRAKLKASRVVPTPASRHLRPQSSINGRLVAPRQRKLRFERARIHLPNRRRIDVQLAVGRQHVVEKLEQLPRHPQRGEGVDQPAVVDRLVEQSRESAASTPRAVQAATRALARS